MTAATTAARPDKARVLSTLKGFQRRTVDHVVRQLLSNGSRRFLVADEVGLGKTLIARGVIAEFVDRAWDDERRRIDVLYVCSNTALASENLKKVHLGGKRVEATRLTLLPKQLPDFDSRLNFVSFTPSTALELRGYGQMQERAVLYALLREKFGGGAWLQNLLQGHAGTKSWRNQLGDALPDVDKEQGRRFRERLAQAKDLQDRLNWARETLTRVDRVLDEEQRSRRHGTVEDLRRLLAHTCIDALEPDLIVLDEFQRFKDLLSSSDDETTDLANLADELFRYRTPEGERVATLLLSATPYRMYSTGEDLEAHENHADFLHTLSFLCDDAAALQAIQAALEGYNRELRRAADGDAQGVVSARDTLQALLKRVMVRTERVDSTQDRDSMVEEPLIPVRIEPRDLRHYMATEELAEQLGSRDMVEFWKSAPYLFNFMKGYQVKAAFEKGYHLKGVRNAYDKASAEFLNPALVDQYAAVDPANGRLRALTEQSVGNGQAEMLWMAPSVPYWPLEEPWRSNAGFSKKLVFSAWNVVPDVVSGLLSYEAERRMVGDDPQHAYASLYRKRRGLLRWSVREGRAANMTTLAFTFPCLTLADEISPVQIALREADVRTECRERIGALLPRLEKFAQGDAPDPRWHWAAPLLLDVEDPTLGKLLNSWGEEEDEEDGEGEGELAAAPGRKALEAHLAEAKRVLSGETELGSMPDTLVDTLVDLALGGPAILTARALRAKVASKPARRAAGVLVADGFRKLFNQAPVMLMLKAGTEDEGYWRVALRYSVAGNLQSVLDEHVHLLWEQAAWDDRPEDEICGKVAEALRDSVTTKVSRVMPDVYTLGDGKIEARAGHDAESDEHFSLRTSFALRYGTVTGSSGATEAREEHVRSAFKSPFFPFVLVSTSVGQEGLDFHSWCHDIWHWNLPGNPVDLEQREGRVHRYKGLAVRRNIAVGAFEALRERWQPGKDPWEVIFEAAEQRLGSERQSELVPLWVAPGPFKVRRCVPALPFSSEVERLQRLKRSLAIYRVVFGQPRQEELLSLLENSDVTREELERWTISLKPE